MHLLKPRVNSEKAYAAAQTTNTFVIDVPKELNKHEVADAVAQQFDVMVKAVRIVNIKGKAKRVMNTTGKRSSNRLGSRPDIKKAYVTLAEGSHLPFFEAEEAEAAEAVKAEEKAAKKNDKKADKKVEKKTSKKEEKN